MTAHSKTHPKDEPHRRETDEPKRAVPQERSHPQAPRTQLEEEAAIKERQGRLAERGAKAQKAQEDARNTNTAQAIREQAERMEKVLVLETERRDITDEARARVQETLEAIRGIKAGLPNA